MIEIQENAALSLSLEIECLYLDHISDSVLSRQIVPCSIHGTIIHSPRNFVFTRLDRSTCLDIYYASCLYRFRSSRVT